VSRTSKPPPAVLRRGQGTARGTARRAQYTRLCTLCQRVHCAVAPKGVISAAPRRAYNRLALDTKKPVPPQVRLWYTVVVASAGNTHHAKLAAADGTSSGVRVYSTTSPAHPAYRGQPQHWRLT
jgi:hypothetical protein